MAQVPYTPFNQFAPPSGAGNNYQQVPGELAGSGAMVGRALGNVAQSLGRLGDTLAESALREQEQLNETLAKEATISGVEQFTKAEMDYRAKKGQDAMGASYEEYQSSIRGIRESMLATMPNRQARRMLDNTMSRYLISGMEVGARHYAKERDDWARGTALGMATLAGNQAVANAGDADKVDGFIASQSINIRQAMAGRSEPEIQATIAQEAGKTYKNVIESLAIVDPFRASAMFERVRERLDQNSAQSIAAYLKPKVDAAHGRAIVNDALRAQRGTVGADVGSATAPVTNSAEDRAQFVFNEARRRGYSPSAAAGITANIQHESRFDPNVMHDGGVGIGILGWNGPRRAALEAKYGKSPTFEQQTEFLFSELDAGGSEERAGAILRRGDITPEQAGADYSSIGVRPRDVEVNRRVRAATAAQHAARYSQGEGQAQGATISPPRPFDPAALMADVDRRSAGLPPEARDHAMSYAQREITLQNAALRADRERLDETLKNLVPALQDGAVNAVPPQVTADIKRLRDPDRATIELAHLDAAQKAGLMAQALQWASPAEAAQIRQSYATGAVTAEMRATIPGLAQAIEGTTENYTLRKAVESHLDAAWARRQRDLDADPANYASRNPTVMEARQSFMNAPDDQKRAALNNYNTTLLGVQAALGVSTQNQRILTEAQVKDQIQKINAAPPGEGMRVLNELAQNYGPHWQRAFGELVKHGKLAPEYQVLASMDNPAQAQASGDMQAALKLMHEKGGKPALEDAARTIDPAVNTNMKAALGPALQAFQATTRWSSGGQQLFGAIYNATETLALYYMAQRGESAGAAVARAVDGILDAKWGMSGSMLFPKAQRAEVMRATSQVQRDLTADRLMPEPVTEGSRALTDEMRANTALRNAQAGQWVPNQNTTGLVLMAPRANGAYLPVMGRDGKAVQVMFDALPAAPPVTYERVVPPPPMSAPRRAPSLDMLRPQ